MSKKPKVIAVSSIKGGVGKTFISVNLAYGLSMCGKTLLIDFDAQATSSQIYGELLYYADKVGGETIFSKARPVLSFSQAVVGGTKKVVDNLYISTSGYKLKHAVFEVASHPSYSTFLSRAIRSNTDSFDYIVIDCPPDMNIQTANALRAADLVLSPLNVDYQSFDGVHNMLHFLDEVFVDHPKDKPGVSLVINNFESRKKVSLRFIEKKIEDSGLVSGFPAFRVKQTASAEQVHGNFLLPIFEMRKGESMPTIEGIFELVKAVR